jgi:hypothetical protein
VGAATTTDHGLFQLLLLSAVIRLLLSDLSPPVLLVMYVGGSLALQPNEAAEARTILAEDAHPNIRVWQMVEEAEGFEADLQHFRQNVMQFEAATDGG